MRNAQSLHVCTYPGCRTLVSGAAKCEKHARKLFRDDADKRGSRHERGYDRAWQKIRKQFLMQHPLCRACMNVGTITAATQVDHITPHRGDDQLRRDERNMQSLCASCHSKKTVLHDGGFGR